MRLLLGFLLSCTCWIVQAQDISRDKLPPEAIEVMALIEAGGPFPHKRDGIVFGNFEKLLPLEKRGYYREYTVRTPGVNHRGARRIVCGGWQASRPAACWYTANHYRSFRKIAQDTTP